MRIYTQQELRALVEKARFALEKELSCHVVVLDWKLVVWVTGGAELMVLMQPTSGKQRYGDTFRRGINLSGQSE